MSKMLAVNTNVSHKGLETGCQAGPATCQAVVIWIDWYAYHVARFQALLANPELVGRVAGIEMVSGIGVHQGLNFRATIPASLPVRTLLPGRSWKDAGAWELAAAVWKQLNRINPSSVLVPGYYTLSALTAALWAKLHGKKSVLMTESTAHDHGRVWWREMVKKLIVRNLFDWAVSGGKPHRRYLLDLGFPVDRIANFYDVVDNEFFGECTRQIRLSHAPADLGLPPEYFLYVGRIASEKNTAALMSAYLRYRESGGTLSLVFVGDGPQSKDLRALAEATPYAADIYFTGLKPTSELPRYYAFASALVLPSIREPWGLVVNEAMAASLPVIVSNRCGCVEDLVPNGQNGFTFDPLQAGALLECLLAFGGLSPSERREMGRLSCEIVSHFSPANWAAEIARIVKA